MDADVIVVGAGLAGLVATAELAWQDWQGTAGFDRPREDHWPQRWARAYVDFAAGEKRAWLRSLGVRFFPVVGWAERGGGLATGPGNSVPRFHIVWGTGPGVVEPFVRQVRAAVDDGLVTLAPRHQVTALTTSAALSTAWRGTSSRPTALPAASPPTATSWAPSSTAPRPSWSPRVGSVATTPWCAAGGPPPSEGRPSTWSQVCRPTSTAR